MIIGPSVFSDFNFVQVLNYIVCHHFRRETDKNFIKTN